MFISHCTISKILKKNLFSGYVHRADGIEFDAVSRGTLLKLLNAVEEQIWNQVRGRRASVKAEFANNKYTQRFIYPEAINAGKGRK
ncbi:hypothetical protein ABMA27_015156 [Loxostege sticticalis]|uniref:Uncharacterized protein n=1 Tax=Loxostege sticticalis TaxID=481309 RepID=A0ABR3I6L4_LOXSC